MKPLFFSFPFALRGKKNRFFKRRLSDPAILAQVNETSEFDIEPPHMLAEQEAAEDGSEQARI